MKMIGKSIFAGHGWMDNIHDIHVTSIGHNHIVGMAVVTDEVAGPVLSVQVISATGLKKSSSVYVKLYVCTAVRVATAMFYSKL